MVSELYRSREREKFSVMFRNTLTDKGYYDLVFGRLYMSSATEPFSTYDVEINDNVMIISYNGVPSSYKRK